MEWEMNVLGRDSSQQPGVSRHNSVTQTLHDELGGLGVSRGKTEKKGEDSSGKRIDEIRRN
jgi:hypothetical protein